MKEALRNSLLLSLICVLFYFVPMDAEAAQYIVPSQFPNIQSAVNAAADGDTIYIMPGTYQESVNTIGKNINLVGSGKDSCVLAFYAMNYDYPPLQMSAGSVKNMTIHAVGGRQQLGYGAYCLHADNDWMEGNNLYFEDVDFINDSYEAVGVGLHPNCTVRFVRCLIESKGQFGALFVHNFDSKRSDIYGQRLVLEGCTMVNNSVTNPSFILQSQGITVPVAEGLFVNNTFVNNAGGQQFLMRTFIVYPAFLQEGQVVVLPQTDWVLNSLSSGNNVAALNAVPAAVTGVIAQ